MLGLNKVISNTMLTQHLIPNKHSVVTLVIIRCCWGKKKGSVKFYYIQNLSRLLYIPLFVNTKSVNFIMVEEGLRNLLTLHRGHQNRPKQFRTRELHCWSLKEKSTTGYGPRTERWHTWLPSSGQFFHMALEPTGEHSQAVRKWERGHLQQSDNCLITKTRF